MSENRGPSRSGPRDRGPHASGPPDDDSPPEPTHLHDSARHHEPPRNHDPARLRNAIDILDLRDIVAALTSADDDSEAIDRIDALEQLKAACAAAQARETVAFDRLTRQKNAALGVPKSRQGRGIGGAVALARRVSPHRGSRLVSQAFGIVNDLPQTRDALATGTGTEDQAAVMHRETSWLSTEHRQEIDAIMAPKMRFLGIRELAQTIRAHAYRVDPDATAAHFTRAATERRVTIRPAPDNMAYLTAILPVPQAKAAADHLQRAAESTIASGEAGDKAFGELVADTLVERLTGKSAAEDVPVELHLVMEKDTLMAGGTTPAWIPGFGPIPAESAREMIGNPEATVFLRRLFTEPESGKLVAMDSRRREFSGLLRRMIVFRDDRCRMPWCDAQIRHIDHIRPYRSGGKTMWDNASGLCARCNYSKETTGWQHTGDDSGLTVRTPTGHAYSSVTSPLVRGGTHEQRRPAADEYRSAPEAPPATGEAAPEAPPTTVSAQPTAADVVPSTAHIAEATPHVAAPPRHLRACVRRSRSVAERMLLEHWMESSRT